MGLNLLPSSKELTIREGVVQALDFQYLDAFGTSINIAGYLFELTCRLVDFRRNDKTVARDSWTLTGAIVSASDGKFRFLFTTLESTIPPGRYPCEMKVCTGGAVTDEPDAAEVYSLLVQERMESP